MKLAVQVLICLLGLQSIAQKKVSIDSVLNLPITKIEAYNIANISTQSILLKMPFAKAEIITKLDSAMLSSVDILAIDLVFSDYPFNQSLKNLNKKRIENLFYQYPFLQNNTQIQWHFIRQTLGKDKASSEQLLHGFIITYREQNTSITLKNEIEEIKSALPPKPIVQKPEKKINNWEYVHNNKQKRYWKELVIKGIFPNERFIKYKLPIEDSAIVVSTKLLRKQNILQPNEEKFYGNKDSLIVVVEREFLYVEEKNGLPYKPLEDSTIYNYFSNTDISKSLVVIDVTASMSKYTAQFLKWLFDNAGKQKINFIVCFNDGNNSKDFNKPIGATGGVYAEKFSSVYNAQELIIKAMQNGSGGDRPENDCEAILEGLRLYPSCNNVILLADNWADIRDIQLVEKINKPVHILLAGNGFGANKNHITLAYKTNGSLHFKNLNITNFDDFKLGKLLTIRGLNYILKDGMVAVE